MRKRNLEYELINAQGKFLLSPLAKKINKKMRRRP